MLPVKKMLMAGKAKVIKQIFILPKAFSRR